MDRITKSYISEFASSHGLNTIIDDTKLFEHFVNYIVIEPRTEERYNIEDVNIDKNGTLGIDGFGIILNKQLINSMEMLTEYLSSHNEISAQVVFIQAKTSNKFETKEIGNFGWAVADFIGEEQKIKWTDEAIAKIKLINTLFANTTKLKNKPECTLVYATLGKNNNDQNVEAKKTDIINDLSGENLFSIIRFDFFDTQELHKRYKTIGQAISKSFEFSNRITLPVIPNVNESYLGIIDAKTIIHLMTDENGELISNVFYDNIRDYQGLNDVNQEIQKTILSAYNDAFVILNNGITIVTEVLTTTRNTFTISNYQIINGCQTAHVIYENNEHINDRIYIPFKLISTANQDLTSQVIRSTNRQTEIKEQDLIAFTSFQKALEDFYKTYTNNQRLYYERRSKQFRNINIEKKRIIDKTTQIKTVTSLYFDNPNMATRYFGSLFKEFRPYLFQENQKMIPYYTASYAFFCIEEAFRNDIIKAKYKKLKYFILMMLRYELNKAELPNFASKKIEAYCDEILEVLNDEEKLKKCLSGIIAKLDKLKLDLSDSDLSKSYSLVTQCKESYSITRK